MKLPKYAPVLAYTDLGVVSGERVLCLNLERCSNALTLHIARKLHEHFQGAIERPSTIYEARHLISATLLDLERTGRLTYDGDGWDICA